MQWIVGVAISVIVGLVGVIATRYFSGTRKHLSFSSLRWPLIEHDVGSRLQLYYAGEEVEDTSIVIIRLAYKGNEPIRPNDYEHPVSFDFDSDARILDAEIVSKRPRNLNAFLIIETNTRAHVEPALFNDRDQMTVKMLVSRCYSTPTVSGRIAGVSEIQDALSPTWFEKLAKTSIEVVYPRGVLLTFVFFFLFLGSFVAGVRLESPVLVGVSGGVFLFLSTLTFAVWLTGSLAGSEDN